MTKKTKISSEDYKTIALQLLKRFSEFCEMHHLTYYLAYGTLLGAVRHKGMIPWDDDIDVQMPREDYNRFIQLYQESKEEMPFYLFCEELDRSYPHYFAKIGDKGSILEFQYMKEIKDLGVFVDVFPMDTVHLKEDSQRSLEIQIQRCLKTLELCAMTKCWPANSVIRTIAKNAFFHYAQMRGTKYWRKKYTTLLDNAAQRHECDKAEYVYAWTVLDADAFGAGCKLTYEDGQYNCPEKYDVYLTKEYGDYMTLPPAEERKSVHDFEAYYVDR